MSKVTKGWDDEEVLAALQQALRAERAVPPEFIEAGKNAFAWHNIDAELAQLTYDSTLDSALELSLRAEAASIRALTFTSAHLTIELEVAQDSLLGQIIPAQPATIKIQPRGGRRDGAHHRRDRLLLDPAHPLRPVPHALPYRRAAWTPSPDGSRCRTGGGG